MKGDRSKTATPEQASGGVDLNESISTRLRSRSGGSSQKSTPVVRSKRKYTRRSGSSASGSKTEAKKKTPEKSPRQQTQQSTPEVSTLVSLIKSKCAEPKQPPEAETSDNSLRKKLQLVSDDSELSDVDVFAKIKSKTLRKRVSKCGEATKQSPKNLMESPGTKHHPDTSTPNCASKSSLLLNPTPSNPTQSAENAANVIVEDVFETNHKLMQLQLKQQSHGLAKQAEPLSTEIVPLRCSSDSESSDDSDSDSGLHFTTQSQVSQISNFMTREFAHSGLTVAPRETQRQVVSINNRQKESMKSYMNRIDWTDVNHQKKCLKNLIELMMRPDESGQMMVAFLAAILKKTFSLQLPPVCPTIHPIVKFDSIGSPHFDFHFQSPKSPLHITEVLKNVDMEVLELSKVIYSYVYGAVENLPG